ncbi:type 1 glutamine amidotransferase domain-containing protein [Conexibacter sp. DBS9H8]|uniref:type 1 glutamine amidotransferase domain-containing protein n=1 Tax=Conexibacter sp. DBS9H8 TaxID=2937801 RepID=UPI00200EFD4B|nr:type 1 glutamine amidotransferase domain-containing protein [Conexibacter sp. DBS9H8]
MTSQLNRVRVAFLFTEGVEQAELTTPLAAVRRDGAATTLVSLASGPVQMFNHLDRSDLIDADVAAADTHANSFDALVLPGGVANPDALRVDEAAVSFVRGFFEADKPVAVICHGAWTLIEAGVLSGRTLTSWPSLQTDLRNAGATWVDEAVHVDGELISSRNPDDLPVFCDALIDRLAAVAQER